MFSLRNRQLLGFSSASVAHNTDTQRSYWLPRDNARRHCILILKWKESVRKICSGNLARLDCQGPLLVLRAELCFYPTRFIFWSPSSQYFRMWLYLEVGSSKRWLHWNDTIRVNPNPTLLVSLKEEETWTQRNNRDVNAQRNDPTKSKQEGHHLQAKERGFRKTKPSSTLTIYFQTAELWKNKFPLFKPSSLWYFVIAALGNECNYHN